ncbi:MAG: CPXCG motif-containing cysteine-rich protein [Flavobacteriia bacterium]|nr:CPXCG motif-containing cysteine-rich protein [Flavobacteriia bacterium]
MLEYYFECPHCWEEQLKLIDPSISQQDFIEDCEVCCNPIEFSVGVSYSEIVAFSAQPIGQ